MSDSGTIRSIKINKIFYPASGEADLSRKSGLYTMESQPTTGDNNFKRMKQSEDVEGVDLVLTGAQRQNLIDFIDSRKDGDLEVQMASGDVFTAKGGVSITSDNSADAKVTVTLHPRKRWTGVYV